MNPISASKTKTKKNSKTNTHIRMCTRLIRGDPCKEKESSGGRSASIWDCAQGNRYWCRRINLVRLLPTVSFIKSSTMTSDILRSIDRIVRWTNLCFFYIGKQWKKFARRNRLVPIFIKLKNKQIVVKASLKLTKSKYFFTTTLESHGEIRIHNESPSKSRNSRASHSLRFNFFYLIRDALY